MKTTSFFFRFRSCHSVFAWLVAALLFGFVFCPDALGMSFRRAPFHKAELLRSLSEQSVWRTRAGYPGATGTNDGPGISARFGWISSIVLDSAGNAYVADPRNHVIRKITPGGMVSTYAGSMGVDGYRDGIVTSALFSSPSALAVDSSGSLYVANSSMIRKISPGGVVSTLAGNETAGWADGTGRNAQFDGIQGLAAYPNGDLFVADSGNHLIRRIGPSGVVSTFVGQPRTAGYQDGVGTNARFGYPNSLARDRSGTLYVSDRAMIRRISPAGVVTTFVGSEKSGYRDGVGTNAWFSGDIGLCIDGQDFLYTSESVTGRIRKISPAGEVTSIAGGNSWSVLHADGTGPFARFQSPYAIAVDSSGHLWVTDSQTIRYGSTGPEPRPVIASQPRSQIVSDGDDVIFRVGAQATLPLSYRWVLNGEAIPGGTNATLSISNAGEANAGEYRAIISDGNDYILSFPASLQVKPRQAKSGTPLNNWRRVAGGPLTQLAGVAFGNGVYVAVSPGQPGLISTSSNGVHWSRQFPATTEMLSDVAFGNGRFVAVGKNGTVLTSANGSEWESHLLTSEGSPELNGVVFAEGLFVGVCGDANGSIWTSPDGAIWTGRGVNYGLSLAAVIHDGTKFIAAGNTFMISSNAIDWVPANGPESFLGNETWLTRVSSSGASYVATKERGDGVFAVSTNGIDWRETTNSLFLHRVTEGGGTFLAVDSNSDGVSTSTNGIDWADPLPLKSAGWQLNSPQIRFDHGLFIANGVDGGVAISSDGQAWAAAEQHQALLFWPDTIIGAEGRFFGTGGPGLQSSTNGTDWQMLFPNRFLSGVASGGGVLVAVGGNNAICISRDGGATWTDRSPPLDQRSGWLSRVAYGQGRFVAAGGLRSGNEVEAGQIFLSNDATNWIRAEYSPNAPIREMTFGAGAFVAIALNYSGGRSGEILMSTNGSAWKSVRSFATNLPTAVAFGNGRFVVVGSPEGNLASTDGLNWKAMDVPSLFPLIVFGNGCFLASGDGRLWSSEDGLAWRKCSGPERNYSLLSAGDGLFLAMDNDGILYRSGPFQQLGNPRPLPDGQLEWEVTGARSVDYQIEYSDDLATWRPLEKVTNATATHRFIDPEAGNHRACFYRTVSE